MKQRQVLFSQLCCHRQVKALQPQCSAAAVFRLETHQQQHWPPHRGTGHKRHRSHSNGKHTLSIAATMSECCTIVHELFRFFFHQKITSSLKIQKAEGHKLYRCMAYNKVGEDSHVIFFHVTRKSCAVQR